jgi:predicted O-methyltransferase YrrM
MNFYQSTVLNNLEKFPIDNLGRLPRDHNDMLQMWKVCKYFQPKSILEIGFSAGQTFGLLLDCTDDDTKYVAVDNDFARNSHIFEEIFSQHPKRKNISMLNIDSRNLNLIDKFDFIHIDANHTYEFVLSDLLKCLPLLQSNSILCMDDTLDPGVDQVIQEHLLGQHDFVPFLAGNKQIFFHHRSTDVQDFVKDFLPDGLTDFVIFDPWNHHGHYLVKMQVIEFVEKNLDIFRRAVKTYNI